MTRRWSRRVGIRVLKFVGMPLVGALFGARQFNLPRFVRRRAFVDLHAAIVTWLDGHFDMLERNGPWLHRIGAEVSDHCSGGVPDRLFRNFMGQRPGQGSASCHRQVTVVYGFDGDPTARLDSLAEALSAAGWVSSGPAGRAMPRWWPNDTSRNPPGLAKTPPWGDDSLSPSIMLGWSDHAPVAEWRVPRPNRTSRATRNYLPLEISAAQVTELLPAALKDHEHALAVTIDLGYYRNAYARSRPYRVPRYVVSTLLGRTSGG